MPGITIGILEDEPMQATMLVSWLSDADYEVFHCSTGKQFLQIVKGSPPDMLILDWQLPDCEGIDVLEELRNKQAYSGPILFATAKDREEDIVRGLSKGADDYLIKPLRRAELLARLAALWRRAGSDLSATTSLGFVTLDVANKIALVDGVKTPLTPTEFQLALCLFENVDKLLSREFLLRKVWGVGSDIDTRTVDVHISRIRKLLRIGPDMGYCIKTVYRHGYRLEVL